MHPYWIKVFLSKDKKHNIQTHKNLSAKNHRQNHFHGVSSVTLLLSSSQTVNEEATPFESLDIPAAVSNIFTGPDLLIGPEREPNPWKHAYSKYAAEVC